MGVQAGDGEWRRQGLGKGHLQGACGRSVEDEAVWPKIIGKGS